MILKNLVVSAFVFGLLGNISFGDDSLATVPVGITPPNIASFSGTTGVPSTPVTDSTISPQGGMDPVVRRIYMSMISPSTQPVLADNGGFVVSSVESYTVDAGVSSCSFIARKNIGELLDAMGISSSWMAQGDANDLIRFGELNHTLTSFTDKKAFVAALDARKAEFFETVFDIYRRVPTRSYAMQGHRVAVFLGDDNQWYILDPIDGEKSLKPQLFTTYLANDVDNAEWFARFPGYSRIHPLDTDSLVSILPFLSSELQMFLSNDFLIGAQESKSSALAEQHILNISEMSA